MGNVVPALNLLPHSFVQLGGSVFLVCFMLVEHPTHAEKSARDLIGRSPGKRDLCQIRRIFVPS